MSAETASPDAASPDAANPDAADPDPARPAGWRHAYWRANLRILVALLTVWFAVSYGCGILLVDWLNGVRIPGTGFKLGFWFAQQGAICVFVVEIFVYVRLMNRLDQRFGVAED